MLLPFKLVRLAPLPLNEPAIAAPDMFRLPVWTVPGVAACKFT